MAAVPRIRQAKKADLDALATLVLTSFRQFRLFAYLHSPLRKNPAFAADTLWFWHLRLWLEILDPNADVLVAELDRAEERVPNIDPNISLDADDEGSTLRDWAIQYRGGKDSQLRLGDHGDGDARGNVESYIVGFAIWNVRSPEGSLKLKAPVRPAQTWKEWILARYVSAKLSFWKALYQRKDQDRAAYSAYLQAEDQLAQMCYSSECVYYLDNLTVDFRFQRQGIGKQLVEYGLAEAAKAGLSAMTEAGEKGEGLYRKLGFRQVTSWNVCGMSLPVMRWTPSSGVR